MNVEIHGENMPFYVPIKSTMDFNWKDDKYENFMKNNFLYLN